ncbi:hypothetical protein SDRG_12854 [Saprolegnia diclina VS20]|uniref:Uncharacterized protein n=1 Tax=Saprolegnia diclina (strain VS20) TaxID=1156394 RepID=T0Q476_SAPDV|nr:hypothetical protein SDRG_12854 [Saprolegnia diclina VS20]EQC29391.1 hypothetical protein SDRG_12854 [Saprolegnia diclina VS20]|eukprot:XP_008617158.1 hypothetical protein SDRG_12854 [Saprolegnia diclina VS20]
MPLLVVETLPDAESKIATTIIPAMASAVPHVLETIARFLPSHDALAAFLHALPRDLLTPSMQALSALVELALVPTLALDFEVPLAFELHGRLSRDVCALIQATLPLAPRVHVRYAIYERCDVELLEKYLCDALVEVTIKCSWHPMVLDDAFFMRDTLLACPRLERLRIVRGHSSALLDPLWLNALLSVLPRVRHFHFRGYRLTSVSHTEFASALLAWLEAPQSLSLALRDVALGLDRQASPLATALVAAIGTSTSLQSLRLRDVDLFKYGVSHLPPQLVHLEWDKYAAPSSFPPTLPRTMARALLEAAQLRSLGCAQLTSAIDRDMLRPALSRLTHASIFAPQQNIPRLLRGLPHLRHLERLDLKRNELTTTQLEAFVRLLRDLPHLRHLNLAENSLEMTDLQHIFAAHLPLATLNVAYHPCAWNQFVHLVPTLVDAMRTMTRVNVFSQWWRHEHHVAILNALATAYGDGAFYVSSHRGSASIDAKTQSVIASLGLGRQWQKPQCALLF